MNPIHRQKAHEIDLRAGQLANQVADSQRLLREMANYLPDLHEIYKSASDEELTALQKEFPGFALFVDAFEVALVEEQANPSAELQSISELPPELKAEAIELVRKSARIEARYRALVKSGPNGYTKQQVLYISRSERAWLEQLERHIDALGLQQLPVATFQTAKAAFAEITVRIGDLASKLVSQAI